MSEKISETTSRTHIVKVPLPEFKALLGLDPETDYTFEFNSVGAWSAGRDPQIRATETL